MAGGSYQFETNELVCECVDKQSAVQWPVPVDHHLDRLVRAAELWGERTTRKELAAAIIAAAKPDGDKLSRALRTYRRMKVEDLLGPVEVGENIHRIQRRRPGPRSRRSG